MKTTMMTVTKTLLATLAIAFALPAVAESVNRTLDADADGEVHVSNISGSIKVEGWDRSVVEVTGTIGSKVEELITERDGDEILIKVKLPKRGGRDTDAHLVIRVPEHSSLDVGTVSAGIEVSGVHGDQDLQSVSGNIETEAFGADVQAEAVSGNVEIRGDNSDGDVEASSVSGNVRVETVSGDIEAESVSGRVQVEGGSFEDADVSSVSGSVRFEGELRSDARLSVETVNGTAEVELIGDVSARFDIETLNGRIRNCFGPKPQRVSKYGPGWELSFSEGDGGAHVEMSTINGGIELCKK